MKNDLIYGFDFGSSNSAIAVKIDNELVQIPVDEYNENVNMSPTILYYSKGHIFAGKEAYQRFKNDPINQKGRFLREIKSSSKISSIPGTIIDGSSKLFEDIISDYISFIKKNADKNIGADVKKVVIGRPFKFSDKLEENKLAQKRIETGARKAGFSEILFAYEPVAATINYLEHISPSDTIMTFDFGGSTLDLHLLGLDKQTNKLFTLSTQGIVLGGNQITKDIIKNNLLDLFGLNTSYINIKKNMYKEGVFEETIAPHNVYSILEFDIKKSPIFYRNLFKYLDNVNWSAGKEVPEAVRLKDCLENNYEFTLFEKTDAAKIILSNDDSALVDLERYEVQRELFVQNVTDVLKKYESSIETTVESMLKEANISANDITLSHRIGGSSQMPYFKEIITRMLPNAKDIEGDLYGGVAKGLAKIGFEKKEEYYVK